MAEIPKPSHLVHELGLQLSSHFILVGGEYYPGSLEGYSVSTPVKGLLAHTREELAVKKLPANGTGETLFFRRQKVHGLYEY